MSIKVEPGYKGYVAVQDTKGRDLYRRDIKSDREIDPWIAANKPSVQGWGVLKSSFIPVRIDNWPDFARDLFLPTFVNHALKINNVCLKILVSCIAIVLDLITYPIRCATWPVRLYCHYTSKPVPVEELIKTSPYFAEAKKEGVVNLVARTEYTKIEETLGDVLGKPNLLNIPYRATRNNLEVSRLVTLKALPWCQEGHSSRDWSEGFYMDPKTYIWQSGGATSSSSSGSAYAC